MVLCGCTGRNAASLDGSGDGQASLDGGPGREGGVTGDFGYLPDVARLPDGFGTLLPCSKPGQSCKAQNPCAINPVCGTDLLCHPTGIQNCDDGLECTEDRCKGMGLCENTPKDGTCALVETTGGVPSIKCFKDGDKRGDDPCVVCDSASDKLRWSPANGGACDDGNACTKNDYCQMGTCTGSYYGDQCADNLSCTDDPCDGKGGCLGNSLMSGWCLINGVCFQDGANDPSGACNKCDVKASTSAWTPIVNACQIAGSSLPPPPPAPPPPPGPTKCYANGDTHPNGTCAVCDTSKSKTAWTITSGCLIYDTCYAVGALDTTGCNHCDPTKSKAAWTAIPGQCSIAGKCYKQGDKHTGGCAECNPTADPNGWTPLLGKCLIDDVCYGSGDGSANGCGTCDPTKSQKAWTPLPLTCLIGGTCHKNGDKDTSGCLQCDSAKNPTGWTPVAGVSAVSQGFESGVATGWTLTNTDASVGWKVSSKKASGGTYALYYGDPAKGNYDSGAKNQGTAAMPALTLTAGKKAALTFSLWIDTEAGTSYDRLMVKVGSTVVWEKNKTQTVTMKTWQQVSVDLTAHAGQSVVITFEFDTVDGVSNTTEGVYIDDLTVYHGC
jgi:hypothetical protein